MKSVHAISISIDNITKNISINMYVSKVYQTAVDSNGDVRTIVRGIPYQCPDDWEDILDSLDEDSNLYLIKDSDNPKDKLSIAAYLDDRRVGYVANSDNGKIWLYLTDEKMPCKFIERFDASFKISFENPRHLFEDMSFEEIYRDKDGVTDEPFAEFEIPFLTNPEDNNYEWLDDRTYILDLEKFIPDFRRKLATRMIILVGRKNSKGEYCYYLPYANNIIADILDEEIKDTIDEYGFVIALPDVPIMTARGGILMDLHVTFLKNTKFKPFDLAHQSELVFHLKTGYIVSHGEIKQKSFEEDELEKTNEIPKYMNKINRTKCIEIKYIINFKSQSAKELQTLITILNQLKEGFNIVCYALNEEGNVHIYLEDDSLFYTIIDIKEKIKIKRVIEKENILVGTISADKNYLSNNTLTIQFYYDYISGNHIDEDITRLWIRDITAQLYHISVPKAKYVGTESMADIVEKKSIDLHFPNYEDDEHDHFDFSKMNITGRQFNADITAKTDEHQKDIYHNSPYVVLARQNPAIPALFELRTLNGEMFDVLTEDLPEDIKLREWIQEEGLIPVTVQSYKKESSGLLTLNYRAFKKKEMQMDVRRFVDAHFMDDVIDIELDEDVFLKIANIIDPNQDGTMTNNLNVIARIPSWASQAAYYIVGQGEPIWLAPSYHPYILDQVHQNNGTQGRVVNYRDNYDGTYHFELKFHIEK
jgi:hypothetical protein